MEIQTIFEWCICIVSVARSPIGGVHYIAMLYTYTGAKKTGRY